MSINPFVLLQDDDIVNYIFKFLTLREPLEAAVACQQFHRCIETASTAALNAMEQQQDPRVVVDQDFWLRIWQIVNAHRTTRHQNHHPMSLSMLLSPSPPPARILLQVARTIPMKQFTSINNMTDGRTRNIFAGPRVLLPPEGNMLAIACFDDGLIRIFDTNTNEFSLCEVRTVELNLPGGGVYYTDNVFSRRDVLLYSNGHLVMAAGRAAGCFAVVWELEYDTRRRIVAIHFRHKILLDLPLELGAYPGHDPAVVVAENGKLYVLRDIEGETLEATEGGESATEEPGHQEIGVYDIATGQRIQAIPCNGIPKCNSLLLSWSSAHLLLFRTGHRDDDGIYALDMENNLSQTSFLSGFGERGIHPPIIEAYHTRCIDKSGCIVYENWTDSSMGMVSIDASGILRRQESDAGRIHFEAGHRVRHVITSANRVYICDNERNLGGNTEIYEYDFMTGRRVRTMCTVIANGRGWFVERVFSNDTTVFCEMMSIHEGQVMLSFLR